MQHHAPHRKTKFEGYYDKFDLKSGAHVVVVISKVADAVSNANAFTFTYVPEHGTKIYQEQTFVDAIDMRRINDTGNSFILEIPEIGYVKHDEDNSTEYNLEHNSFSFHAKSTKSTIYWPSSTKTPEGLLVNLPLPLHWHVKSLASPGKVQLKIPNYDLPAEDSSSEAIVHQEKNWAYSFPTAHMWIQARKDDQVICAAGGEILGMKAFLVGYHSNDLDLAFRPPFALRIPGFGPFMSYTLDWESRSFELNVQSFRKKIQITASAPKGTFFSLAAPFAEGHRPNYLGQSLKAKIDVRIYESGWSGPWRLVHEDVFHDGGLEFGGAYYPMAGSEARFN